MSGHIRHCIFTPCRPWGNLAAAAFALLFIAPLTNPAAAQNRLALDVSEAPIWDSNPLMAVNNGDSIWGSATRASIFLDRNTPDADLQARLSAVHNQFNESAFNSNDFFFDTNLAKRSDLLEWSLLGKANYDTTRTGDITELEQSVNLDKRLTWQIAPGVAYALSPRSTLAFNTNWLERHYAGDSSLTDYRTTSFTPSLSFKLTPLQTALFSFQAQRYNSLDAGNRKVDSLGPSVGWKYRFSPKFSLDLLLGFLGSKFSGYPSGNGSWEINPTYSASFKYMGLRNQTAFTLMRTRQPSGNGTESDLASVRLENKFAINQNWALDTQALYQKTEQGELSTNNLDTAWEGLAALIYKASDRWKLSISHKYRQESLANGRGEADRNIAKIELTYSFGPPPSP